jgi:prepilin-type processing-associated H-X9-DG protein/prepilin-type N-terminal cleavage/methylation domain-containing protein
MRRPAFTLVELFVVIAVLALLLAILLPGLAQARDQARSTACQSNLRQLHLANENYALANNGHYVPAASDIWDAGGGRHRWHGVRRSIHALNTHDAIFDPRLGPLARSLADGMVKACPAFGEYATTGNAFEAGTGGYGYNARGVGSREYEFGFTRRAAESSMQAQEIRQPSRTVMFTDAALPQGYPQQMIVEYSFAEPPHFVSLGPSGPVESSLLGDPSIHFRHRRQANAAWCDGHVSPEQMSFTKPTNIYQGDNHYWQVGWFGPQDNSLFAPE